jgi:hypothetical protein
MKALYFKELRQGRPLLIFGLVMGLLIAATRAVLGHTTWFGHASDSERMLDAIFGIVMLAPVPLIALLAGAGLLAVEVERSTAAVLLSLPISRRGIWFAKLLAGLTLTALSAVLLLGVAVVLMPRAATSWTASMLLPDCYVSSLALFAVAFFCSALAAHTVASVIIAVLLTALLTTGSAYLYSLGGFLLGYDPAFDMELWVFCAIPALLISGALVITRGELLQSWRKWGVGLVALVVTVALTVLVVVGMARWATRYQRAAVVVAHADSVGTTGPMSAIQLLTSGAPVPVERFGEAGWVRVDAVRWLQGYRDVRTAHLGFRSTYAVSLDAGTGRELLALRRPSGDGVGAAYTKDGRSAAFALRRVPLTWGRPAEAEAGDTLAIYDLQRRSLVFSGLPAELREQGVRFLTDLRWSASGDYLAVSGGPSESSRGASSVYLLRPEGALHRVLPPLDRWEWSPKEDALFGFGGGGMLYRCLPEGGDRVIWQQEGGPPREAGPYGGPRPFPRPGSLAISPDGRSLAFSTATARTRTDIGQGSTVEVYRDLAVHVMHADGRDHRVLSLPVSDGPAQAEYSEIPGLLWSSDDSTLYALAARQLADNSVVRQLFRWRTGDPGLAPVAPLVGKAILAASYARPDSDEIVVTLGRLQAPPEAESWRGGSGPEEAAPTFGIRELVLLDTHDGVRPVRTPAGQEPSEVIGFDGEGRLLVVCGRRDLIAVDVETGGEKHVYP